MKTFTNQHPAMIRAVLDVKSKSTPKSTFLCLSNANSVFISTILKVLQSVTTLQPFASLPSPTFPTEPVAELVYYCNRKGASIICSRRSSPTPPSGMTQAYSNSEEESILPEPNTVVMWAAVQTCVKVPRHITSSHLFRKQKHFPHPLNLRFRSVFVFVFSSLLLYLSYSFWAHLAQCRYSIR